MAYKQTWQRTKRRRISSEIKVETEQEEATVPPAMMTISCGKKTTKVEIQELRDRARALAS